MVCSIFLLPCLSDIGDLDKYMHLTKDGPIRLSLPEVCRLELRDAAQSLIRCTNINWEAQASSTHERKMSTFFTGMPVCRQIKRDSNEIEILEV